MKRAATVLVNEPMRLTKDEHRYLVRTAEQLLSELTLQKEGWVSRSAQLILGMFKTFQGAVRRGRATAGDADGSGALT